MIPDNIFNFMQWLQKETYRFQNNACEYKKRVYFLDRKTDSGKDGGLNSLWAEYIKSVLG